MSWRKANSVFSVAFPIYVISRIFGFLPFSLAYDRKLRTTIVRVTVFDIIWLCLSLLLHIFFFIFNWIADQQSQVTDSRILIISGRLTLWGGFFMAIFAMLMDLLNRNRIWEIIVKFNEFDEEIHQLGAPKFEYSSQRSHVIYWYLGMGALQLLVTIITVHQMMYLDVHFDYKVVLFGMSTMAVTYTMTYLFMIHMFLLMSLKSRFAKLNKHLEDNLTFDDSVNSIEPALRNLDEPMLVRHISILHEKLIDIMELVNRCYSMQVSGIGHSFPERNNITPLSCAIFHMHLLPCRP